MDNLGGIPDDVVFANQKRNLDSSAVGFSSAQGPFAVPGRVGYVRFGAYSSPEVFGGASGSAPYIIVGQTVTFPYSDETGYSSITGTILDRFGNLASFPTQATISIYNRWETGNSRTVVIGNTATSQIGWGLGQNGAETLSRISSLALPDADGLRKNIAAKISPALGATGVGYPPITNPQIASHIVSFPNFQVWGATGNHVTLSLGVIPDFTISGNMIPVGGGKWPTSATVNLFPGPAVAITPVLTPDPFNDGRPARIPSRFYIGRSNANGGSFIYRQWFHVQAVDEFGNRADIGPNAYNGGTAIITFYSPEIGLPRSMGPNAAARYPPKGFFQFSNANDPFVKVNTQRYSATGTSAVAVNGLYTFKNFTPIGPPSTDPLGNDVVLTFEDTSLRGYPRCYFTSCVRPLFTQHPPITTATTTFSPVPIVSISIPESGQQGAPTNGSVRIADNALLLREKAPTYAESDRRLEAGSVRIERAVTAFSNDIAVGYNLRYFNLDSNARTAPSTPFLVRTPRTFELNNEGNIMRQLPAPITATPPPVPIFPAPLPESKAVQINGLQGDLSPIIPAGPRPLQTVNVTQVPGTFFLDAGTTQQRVNFTARWSDQVWSRTPARQGLRAAVISLLNPDTQNATVYEVDKTSGKDSAFVFLLDPREMPPVLLNPIQDKVLVQCRCPNPADDRIELESPKWQSGNIPGWVFYDDNYDPLAYSTVSSDPTKIFPRIEQSDPRFQGRPSLYYQVQPGIVAGDTALITIFAFDGTRDTSGVRRMAVDDFIVHARSNYPNNTLSHVNSSVDDANLKLSLSPNPVGISNDEASVQFTLRETSDVRIELVSMQGSSVMSIHAGLLPSGEHRYRMPIGDMPSGVYAVRLLAGVQVQTAMLTVVR